MIPYLDPGLTLFERPTEHGYRVFYRTVEDHRWGMIRTSITNRINYETKWMTPRQIVQVGLKAVHLLMEAKAECSFLRYSWVEDYASKIDDALEFIDLIHEIDCIGDEVVRKREL